MDAHYSMQDIYDTELNCSKCSARLYVSAIGIVVVLESLNRTGMAGLLCTCGHTQFINPGFQPISHQPEEQSEE